MSCPGDCPTTWPRRPLTLSPGQAVEMLPLPSFPALAGISEVQPVLLPALPFPGGSGPFVGPVSDSTLLHWPGHYRRAPRRVSLCCGHPGPLVTPRNQPPSLFPDGQHGMGLLRCPGRASRKAGPVHEGLTGGLRPLAFHRRVFR